MNTIRDLMNPQVSVILPVYNRRHLLMRAIESVERQTWTDWELLIVDDGSDDGVESLILPEILRQPRWRYLKHANRKLNASRNIGLHAALGRYITFLDADDEYLPEHLALRVRYLQQHPEVALLHGGLRIEGPQESHYVRDAYHPERLIHIDECVVGGTLFGRREVFIDNGGFKLLDYSAESELVNRLSGRYTIIRFEEPTYIYYTGLADSICTMKKKDSPLSAATESARRRR